MFQAWKLSATCNQVLLALYSSLSLFLNIASGTSLTLLKVKVKAVQGGPCLPGWALASPFFLQLIAFCFEACCMESD